MSPFVVVVRSSQVSYVNHDCKSIPPAEMIPGGVVDHLGRNFRRGSPCRSVDCVASKRTG